MEDNEKIKRTLMQLIQAQLHLQMEVFALETALTESGVLSQEELRRVRERVKAEAKALADSLGEPTLEKLAEKLRGLGGDIQ
jgi:DNA-binding transcriptional regulator YiaG